MMFTWVPNKPFFLKDTADSEPVPMKKFDKLRPFVKTYTLRQHPHAFTPSVLTSLEARSKNIGEDVGDCFSATLVLEELNLDSRHPPALDADDDALSAHDSVNQVEALAIKRAQHFGRLLQDETMMMKVNNNICYILWPSPQVATYPF